jgi:cyclohexyl-isocyanide hydratase
MSDPLRIGFLVFPKITQLDLAGPYEALARMPDTTVHLLSKVDEPIRSEWGMTILPTDTFERSPKLDVLCVPGGAGVNPLMADEVVLNFLREQAAHSRYVTAVCTGALLLGAAGLLRGYRATTHWLSLDLLTIFGAEPVAERVVVDRNRITGAGVTAGIDFGLAMIATLRGESIAREIQLQLEYDPAPPFVSGSPGAALAATVTSVREKRHQTQLERRRLAELAASRLQGSRVVSREKKD